MKILLLLPDSNLKLEVYKEPQGEFSPWHKVISGVSAARGRRLDPQHSGLKGQMLPQLQRRSQMGLGSHPWPGKFICCGAVNKIKYNKMKNKKPQE